MNSPGILLLEKAFENSNVYICIIHFHLQINGLGDDKNKLTYIEKNTIFITFKADNSYNFNPIALKMPYLFKNTLFFYYILEFVSLVNYYEHRTELPEDHFPFWWRNGGHLGFSVLRWILIEMKIVWKKSSASITSNYPQFFSFYVT